MATTLDENQTRPETPTSVSEAAAMCRGWGDVAAFLAVNPKVAERAALDTGSHRMLAYLGEPVDAVEFMVTAARACVDAGGVVRQCRTKDFGGVDLFFGPVHVHVYTEIDRVFAQRVTGMVEQVEYTLVFDLPVNAETPAVAR
ncbi:hypothetical protein [Sphaerisporangium sp. TRM90804]|uniref:hypothetical protein n=1 Tax=Sphaerisporangium sp. TRM90804 TaxID=3031113 RepID=UPI0024487F00|nr:hypothetical protein [Sphaerisporangium sp. TRM90804]MDH2424855.1 hypothetical protein [Sphaerisporangium sp. TRM90804]